MISLIVPFRSTCPNRLQAWGWLRRRWEQMPDVEIVEAPDSEDANAPWRKAIAVHAAVKRSRGDVLVISDADVWCAQTFEAAAIVAQKQAPWAAPHRNVYRLSATTTAEVIDSGADPEELFGRLGRQGLAEGPYSARLGGGIMVVSRETYMKCPLDPRFSGWGGEDESWGRALATLWDGHRIPGRLWHLWHPPASRLNRAQGSADNSALAERYRDAMRRGTETVRILLNEARVILERETEKA